MRRTVSETFHRQRMDDLPLLSSLLVTYNPDRVHGWIATVGARDDDAGQRFVTTTKDPNGTVDGIPQLGLGYDNGGIGSEDVQNDLVVGGAI